MVILKHNARSHLEVEINILVNRKVHQILEWILIKINYFHCIRSINLLNSHTRQVKIYLGQHFLNRTLDYFSLNIT